MSANKYPREILSTFSEVKQLVFLHLDHSVRGRGRTLFKMAAPRVADLGVG